MRSALLVTLVLVAAWVDAAPVLQVAVEAPTVSVRGAKAGGDVLFVGLERSAVGHEPRFRRIERILRADAAGRAEASMASADALDTFWVAVDLSTGAFGAAVPHGSRSRGGPLPAAALIKGQNGRVEKIAADADHAFVIVVRPASGAWRSTAGDGAPSDADQRANGRIEVAAGSLAAIRGDTGPGDGLRNGDVVLIFRTHAMTFAAGVLEP